VEENSANITTAPRRAASGVGVQVRVDSDLKLSDMGKVFAESGFFQDSRQYAQAVVKIIAGQELGFPPVQAMTSINIIKGQVSLSALAMAALIKKHPKYDYEIVEHTDEVCRLKLLEWRPGQVEPRVLGESKFDIEDAQKAGTQNMQKFPRNMLFARAISNAARWTFADVFMGPIYTPEELGALVDESGALLGSGAGPAAVGQTTATQDLNKALAEKAGANGGDPPSGASQGAQGEPGAVPTHSDTSEGEKEPPAPSGSVREPVSEAESLPAPTNEVQAASPLEGDPGSAAISTPTEPEIDPEAESEPNRAVPETLAMEEAKGLNKSGLIGGCVALEKALGLEEGLVQKKRVEYRCFDLDKAHTADLRQYFVWLSTR